MATETTAKVHPGRHDATVIDRYLRRLEAQSVGGVREDPAKLLRRLEAAESALKAGDLEPRTRLHLIQDRISLQRRLEALNGSDEDELERQFLEVVQRYSERHGLSYAAWRAVGVPARVLKLAGLGRGLS